MFDYTKPGPGVDVNAPVKNRFFVYWELLGRKFWKIITANCIFALFLVVDAVLCMGVIYLVKSFTTMTPVLLYLCCIPIILLGPFWAGLTKLTRDFAREEPGFLWADFIDTIKKNWKQALCISFIDYVVLSILSAAVSTYASMAHESPLYIVALCISILISIIFLFSQYYLMLIVVTINLRLRQIIRNAIIFSFLCVFKNLLITVILAAVGLLMLILGIEALNVAILMPVALILLVGFLFAFISFTINFIVYPSLQRYAIDPYYDRHPEQTAEGVLAAREAARLENHTEEHTAQDSEYVYENGRMVHRSLIEGNDTDSAPKGN